MSGLLGSFCTCKVAGRGAGGLTGCLTGSMTGCLTCRLAGCLTCRLAGGLTRRVAGGLICCMAGSLTGCLARRLTRSLAGESIGNYLATGDAVVPLTPDAVEPRDAAPATGLGEDAVKEHLAAWLEAAAPMAWLEVRPACKPRVKALEIRSSRPPAKDSIFSASIAFKALISESLRS